MKAASQPAARAFGLSISTGLQPVFAPSCRVLILGSLPGAESLRLQQYYAHPRNSFWELMASVLGFAQEGLSQGGVFPEPEASRAPSSSPPAKAGCTDVQPPSPTPSARLRGHDDLVFPQEHPRRNPALRSPQDLTYPQRLSALLTHDIALWDVLASGHRPGSLDSAIDLATAQVNPFNDFLRELPALQRILFNGAMAERLFVQRVLPQLSPEQHAIPRLRLPSTSPANASIPKQEKLIAWRAALELPK